MSLVRASLPFASQIISTSFAEGVCAFWDVGSQAYAAESLTVDLPSPMLLSLALGASAEKSRNEGISSIFILQGCCSLLEPTARISSSSCSFKWWKRWPFAPQLLMCSERSIVDCSFADEFNLDTALGICKAELFSLLGFSSATFVFNYFSLSLTPYWPFLATLF